MTTEKIPKQNSRAIQTLFRTLSKNNYALEEMIDRKASIMITTNAIIISIILGSTLCQNLIETVAPSLILLLLGIWVVSIVFALYCIKPFHVSPQKLQWQNNKLINIQNIGVSSIEQYKQRVFGTLLDERGIYESMIEDIFQIGQNIKRKHFYLKLSAYAFLTGIVLSVVIYAMNFVV